MFERFSDIKGFLSIPLSGNYYSINILGEILDKEGNRVKQTIDSDGHLFVFISLWDGLRKYKVSVLVALTFKPTSIPFYLWSKLDIMHCDGNFKNIHPSNLVWKFPKGGLFHNHFIKFVYIPGYSKYIINELGQILYSINGKPLNHHFEKGYAKYKLIPDIGAPCNIGRHRLMALAWLPYPEIVDFLVVNHLNHIPGDDRLDNLEWCTRKRNNIHSYESGRTRATEILVRNVITGEVKQYSGYRACATALGLHKDTILFRVKAIGQIVYANNLQFKLKTDTSPWREITPDDLKEKFLNVGEPSRIKSRHIQTKEVKVFASIAEASRVNKTPIMTIHSNLRIAKVKRPVNGFSYKYEDDETPWTEYTANQIAMYLAVPVGRTTGVVVTNTQTNEEHVFLTVQDAIIFLRVGLEMVFYALTHNSKIKKTYSVKRI